MSRAAVFLDRDGTINVEKQHLYRYEDWEWIPGAIDAIKMFNANGFLVIVVSNQAGIARGLYSELDVRLLHEKVDLELCSQGAKINAYYYCPHHPEFGNKIVCGCRKPAPGLLFRAQKDWGIELSRSFMIGDKADDVKAAQAAGVKSILVSTGYGTTERHLIDAKTPFVRDLMMASLLITTGELNLDVRHATKIS